MAPVPELIEVILKSLTDRIALAVFFVALLVILVAKALPATAVGNWTNEHLAWVYLSALAAICYLPTRHIIAAGDKYIESRGHRMRVQKRLKALGLDDQSFLCNPIKSKKMAFQTGTAYYHIAKSLEKREILSEMESVSGHYNFVIDQDAYDYLIEHSELVGLKKDS